MIDNQMLDFAGYVQLSDHIRCIYCKYKHIDCMFEIRDGFHSPPPLTFLENESLLMIIVNIVAP